MIVTHVGLKAYNWIFLFHFDLISEQVTKDKVCNNIKPNFQYIKAVR